VIGDRGENRGPASFDAAELEMMVRNATLVVVDVAEPWKLAYDFFTMCVDRGARVLVIQTVEDRRAIWHEFLRSRLRRSEILELQPVSDDPSRVAKISITDLSQGK
jgi:hypothetical protein